MCGIAGIVDFRGRAIDRAVLEALREALAHRGPDDTGIWEHHADGWSVGLVHTRLAVIDPTPEGHQPMLTPDGRWAIAYNGELYNYRALQGQLARPPRTACDTEVALNACAEWGPDALGRFDAMWAMAVVDTATRSGHLSRDPFGIKPLYYAHHDGRLVFASEMATLRCVPDLPTEIDPEALSCYLNLGWIPHPMTIYRHVRKLPPGHVLEFGPAGPGEPRRFYRLPPPPESPAVYPAACGELRRLIEAAVARQRVADVPLGAFLSGGLDSSIVVACLSRAGSGPIRTFSIGYQDHPRYDETRYARLVAEYLGTEHHEFRLGFSDVLKTVEPMLDHLGEPFADSSLLPTSLVSRHTRQHVTVALSGDGGDELFGGYWRYLGHHYLERYRSLPGCLRRGVIEPLLGLVPEARSTRWLDRLRQVRKLVRGDGADPMGRHVMWARHLDDRLTSALMVEAAAGGVGERLVRMYREAAHSWHPGWNPPAGLDEILFADLAVGLPADMLHKVDTASMAHSLEVRVPLLSADVVEFVAGLPVEYKIQGGHGKRILRDAFRGVLPEMVFDRPKMGFEVPVGEFLRDELRAMYHDVVTPDVLGEVGIDSATAVRLYEDHLNRRRDHAELLWALLVLCWWRRRE